MICYKDRTFCASPNCENKCGRKPTKEDLERANALGLPMSFGYFCSEVNVNVADKKN